MKKYILISLAVLITCTLAIAHTPVSEENPNATSASSPQVYTFEANGVTFEMVRVEGGTFTMGATAEQGNDAYADENPVHE